MTDKARSAADGAGTQGLLIRVTIFRPVSVLMLGLSFLVVGWIAYPRIPLQLMPEGISSGSCNVYIPVPDSTPREVMEQVVKPAEDQLRTIPGIQRIISSSGARRANIHLEYSSKIESNLIAAEVRDRLDRAKMQWPVDVERYFVWRHSASDMPVYVAALSMDVDEEKVDVDHIFDEVIKKRLVAVDGVARVNVWGILDKRVEIGLDPNKVDAYDVQIRELIERLSMDNRAVNAGTVREDDKEFLVRVDGKFQGFAEVAEYPAGEKFRIGDFATVGFGYNVRDRMSRVNGHRSRVIVVNKESSANAVVVCDRIAAALKDLEGSLRRTVPGLGSIAAHTWMNQGEMIRYSIASVKESGLWGAFFAVVILYLFLRRTGMTVLVTLAIPFSLVMTLVWMFFRGQSFNLLTLMGMTLGIGMLVDNSIVVVENIVRHRAAGYAPREAAIRGVKEVGLAVTLATLTTVIVFLPGVFVSDPMIRGFFISLGEPMSVSVISSLVVALVFVPQGAVILEEWASRRRSRRGIVPPPAGAGARFSWFNRSCARWAHFCVSRRLDALLLTLGMFGFAQFLYGRVPKDDMQMDGPRRLEVQVELQKNFTLREADAVFAAIEKEILDRKAELKVKSVTSWFSSNEGEVDIFLELGVNVKVKEFYERLQPILPRQAGVKYRLGFEDFARDEGGERIRVFVRGNDLDRLEELGNLVKADLEDREKFPELEEVTQWREREVEEVRVEVARRLAQEYGTDTVTVSRMVSWALRGAMLPDFEAEDREYPFWMNYGERVKENVEQVGAVRVFRPGAEPVRLENMARVRITPGSGEIHRFNGKMTVAYSARVTGDATAARFKVERHFARFALPEGFEITLRQERRGFEQDFKNLLFATGLSLVLVFFVMGVLFESYLLPLSVLFSIPHAFFGSVLFLWITQTGLNMIGLLGALMLVGIVVNNAIVLVDCVNRLRLEGMDRTGAIIRAIQVRFRPIWMTALTTIFGLVPLLILPPSGEGIDYKPIAIVLIGGLTTSTFFTLFVVPLFYTLFDDLRAYLVAFVRLDSGALRRLGRVRSERRATG